MKKIKKSLYKFIGYFTVSLFFIFQLNPGGSEASFLSVRDETILGQKFVLEVKKHFNLVEDDFVNNYINSLGHYLIRPLETRHFPFRFYIIKQNDPNAFAAPGGHIFIFTGLIEVMDDLDELVGVMCHEIAHVSARHLSSRIEQSKKIGIAQMVGMIAGILLGGKAGGALVAGTSAAAAQAQLNYSRNDERQADQLGYKYIVKSRFDPSGLITSLKKIQLGQWLDTGRIPSYLLTHPTGPDRMSNLDVMMSNYSPRPDTPETTRFRALFPFFKMILTAKYTEPHMAEKQFRSELEKDPHSAMVNFGLGILLKERSEYDPAIDHFMVALQGRPESSIILQNLGETYQLKGQDARAIEVFEKALKKDTQNQQTLFLLAGSYQNLEEHSKAIPIYERITSMRPVFINEAFYRLGVSYGRRGRLARAHYNFGIYFKRLGRRDKALFHFEKAGSLAGNDPTLKSKINKAMEGLR